MSERLEILIPDDLAARLRKVAESARISESELVRIALQCALEREGEARDPVAMLGELDAPTADIDRMIEEIQADRS